MGRNRDLKKQKKRKAKKKAHRNAAIQAKRMQQLSRLSAEAEWADDPAERLKLLKKAYKIEPEFDYIESDMMDAAHDAGDEDTLCKLVIKRLKKGRPCYPNYMLIAARRLFEDARYNDAEKAAEKVIDSLDEWAVPKRRSVISKTKTLLKRVQKARLAAFARPAGPAKAVSKVKKISGPAMAGSSSPPEPVKKSATQTTPPVPDPLPDQDLQTPELSIDFEYSYDAILAAVKDCRRATFDDYEILLNALNLSFHSSYDQLLCISTLRDVRSMWHQEETARKVLKDFRGRALLSDEVGLGKTIEAGMILKEYFFRGLIKNVLVLAPTSLVDQWREELKGKFGMEFVTTSDPAMASDPSTFWQQPFIVASLNTAKSKRNFDTVVSRNYDMVIVDEAHHLKNRTTLNWKLVNSLKKTFILMLTATPVQNRLEELYNLITVLKPGQLKTLKAFKEEFVKRGDPTMPQNRLKLKGLLKDVMIRNTRSVANIQLPPREAFTVRVSPGPEEEALYNGLSDLVVSWAGSGASGMNRLTLKTLLEVAGSSHAAAASTIRRVLSKGSAPGHEQECRNLLELAANISRSSKARELLKLLGSTRDQVIIFVRFLETLKYLEKTLTANGIRLSTFHGGLNAAAKEEMIQGFREGRSKVLLSTESGGEGRNLQFCHVMVNYDLPWNPMQIEQRIGRIHRIGQEEVVQIHNFCAAGSLEDYMLFVLDRKINMFELVVGEVDMILGRLRGEKEFADRVFEIWTKSGDPGKRKKGFDALGRQLKRARSSYDVNKKLDEKLFGEDFEL